MYVCVIYFTPPPNLFLKMHHFHHVWHIYKGYHSGYSPTMPRWPNLCMLQNGGHVAGLLRSSKLLDWCQNSSTVASHWAGVSTLRATAKPNRRKWSRYPSLSSGSLKVVTKPSSPIAAQTGGLDRKVERGVVACFTVAAAAVPRNWLTLEGSICPLWVNKACYYY